MSRSMKIPRGGRESKAKHFEEKYGVKMAIFRWVGASPTGNNKIFSVRGIDTFFNNTKGNSISKINRIHYRAFLKRNKSNLPFDVSLSGLSHTVLATVSFLKPFQRPVSLQYQHLITNKGH